MERFTDESAKTRKGGFGDPPQSPRLFDEYARAYWDSAKKLTEFRQAPGQDQPGRIPFFKTSRLPNSIVMPSS